MFDVDHMMNGSVSRQHHQEMLDEAEKYRQAKQARHDEKRDTSSTLRRMLALINLK